MKQRDTVCERQKETKRLPTACSNPGCLRQSGLAWVKAMDPRTAFSSALCLAETKAAIGAVLELFRFWNV